MRAPTPLDVFACPLGGIRQIEASAGTGKTWNICGLYLRLLIERRLAVQHILISALESLDLGWPDVDYDIEVEKKRLATS